MACLCLRARVAAAVERVLVFDDIKKTDLQASFQSDCVATQPPANFQRLQRVPTKTNAFFLYFDPSLIEPARFGKFFDYTFHIAVAGASPPVWYSCGTQVYTQGRSSIAPRKRISPSISAPRSTTALWTCRCTASPAATSSRSPR